MTEGEKACAGGLALGRLLLRKARFGHREEGEWGLKKAGDASSFSEKGKAPYIVGGGREKTWRLHLSSICAKGGGGFSKRGGGSSLLSILHNEQLKA